MTHISGMRALFLDVDGVLNTDGGLGGVESARAALVRGILADTAPVELVVSSSWRKWPDLLMALRAMFGPAGATPTLPRGTPRGEEIAQWLAKRPEIGRYAILDDETDFLPDQRESFFHTPEGLTPAVARAVVRHLNEGRPPPAAAERYARERARIRRAEVEARGYRLTGSG